MTIPLRIRLTALAVIATILLVACGGGSPTQTTAPATSASTTADFSDLGALPEEKVQPADVDWGDLDITDQRLFTILSEIDETFRTKAAEVWTEDFRMDQTPLVFAFRNTSREVTATYVLHHPDGASLPGAALVELDESLGLGDVYRVAPEALAEVPPANPFDFDAAVGGTSTMLFFIDEDDSFLQPTTWTFARFVVHETFHRFQLLEERWDESYPDGTPYPRDAENAALAAVEDKALTAMVSATDISEIERRLAQVLAVRQLRHDRFPLGNLEEVQELGEGTARYVENRYAEVNGRPGDWETHAGTISLEWLEFSRFYMTGAAFSWALDALGVEWKSGTTSGVGPTQRAIEHVTLDDPAALVEQAKAEFGFDALLDQAVSADLEHQEGFGGGNANDDLLECLVDAGIEVDPDLDVLAVLNGLDHSDPQVRDTLEGCGVLMTGSGPDGDDVGEEAIINCLVEAGIEVDPDVDLLTTLNGLNLFDPAVQETLESCGITMGEG